MKPMNRLDASNRFVRLIFRIALLAVVMPAGLSSAQDAKSAKAFLASIYRHYENGGNGINIGNRDADRYFSASLLALVQADAKAAGPQNVGAIDADPICACQDWEGIWNLDIVVNVGEAKHAQAAVSFSLSPSRNYRNDASRSLRIKLISVRGGWKIDDIIDLTDPKAPYALRKALVDDIQLNRRAKR